ncbi:zinc finger, SWIM-type [Artemisia annua]|uniref:Zinc finger, SWIM-type n=1 Tax=Artemisia annua TaxID=35608 RepID=A0A2U1LT28_ARTAN|nr:zinc finger, SWIM-type [Artemisia annua]
MKHSPYKLAVKAIQSTKNQIIGSLYELKPRLERKAVRLLKNLSRLQNSPQGLFELIFKQEVYSFKIQPCSGRADWKKSTCLTTLTHPHYRAQVGRPKKKRVRGQLEDTPCIKDGKLSRKRRTVRCSSCGNPGHNKQSCKGQGSATTSGSKNTSKGKGENVEASGGSSGNPRPRKKVRFCLDDYIECSPSFVARKGGSNTARNGTPPSANQSGERSGASTTTIESQRHPNATPSCQSGISSGSSPGSPRWNRHAIRNDIYRGGGVSKRVGPDTPNKT